MRTRCCGQDEPAARRSAGASVLRRCTRGITGRGIPGAPGLVYAVCCASHPCRPTASILQPAAPSPARTAPFDSSSGGRGRRLDLCGLGFVLMSMICDSCGTENPPGTRFCVNTDCQAYLTWPDLDAGTSTKPASLSSAAGSPTSSEVKPGALPDPGVDTPFRSRPTPETAPLPNALNYTAGKPARLVDPPAKKAAVEPPLPQTAQGPRRYSFIRETKAPVAVQPIDETPAPQAARPVGHQRQAGSVVWP